MILRYGFMETPGRPDGLRLAISQGQLTGVDLSELTYYLGRETIVPTRPAAGHGVWREELFAAPAPQRRALGRLLLRAGAPSRRDRDGDRDLRLRGPRGLLALTIERTAGSKTLLAAVALALGV